MRSLPVASSIRRLPPVRSWGAWSGASAVNANIAEYHVPVNADVHDIKVIFVEEPDRTVNPLGIKSVGEIGIVGVAAAVANAVYHATGKRVRDLPITIDKIIG